MADKVKSKEELTEIELSIGGILAKMWRLIVFDSNLHTVLRFYLDRYKLRGGGISKSTIIGYFGTGSMTWRTFMLLMFDILPVKKMRITIELTMVNNDIIVQTETITDDDIRKISKEEKDIYDRVIEKNITEGNKDDKKQKTK